MAETYAMVQSMIDALHATAARFEERAKDLRESAAKLAQDHGIVPKDLQPISQPIQAVNQ